MRHMHHDVYNMRTSVTPQQRCCSKEFKVVTQAIQVSDSKTQSGDSSDRSDFKSEQLCGAESIHAEYCKNLSTAWSLTCSHA